MIWNVARYILHVDLAAFCLCGAEKCATRTRNAVSS